MSASATTPAPVGASTVVSDLAARRDERIWSKDCLECERKFGHRVARLYPLINVPGGISTPLGQATLFTALESGCQVLTTRGRKTGRDASGKPYRPLVAFPVEAIEPYTHAKESR